MDSYIYILLNLLADAAMYLLFFIKKNHKFYKRKFMIF